MSSAHNAGTRIWIFSVAALQLWNFIPKKLQLLSLVLKDKGKKAKAF